MSGHSLAVAPPAAGHTDPEPPPVAGLPAVAERAETITGEWFIEPCPGCHNVKGVACYPSCDFCPQPDCYSCTNRLGGKKIL